MAGTLQFEAPQHHNFSGEPYSSTEESSCLRYLLPEGPDMKALHPSSTSHQDAKEDSWDFDAPRWADLRGVNSLPPDTTLSAGQAAAPPAAAPVQHGPAPAAGNLPSGSQGVRADKAQVSASLTKSNKPPTPVSRVTTRHKQQPPMRPQANSAAAGAFATPQAGAARNAATRPTQPRSQPPVGRTFANRPVKKNISATETPQQQQQQQQHSYLEQSAAKNRKQALVNSMASFLRPTAASWNRHSKDRGAEARSASAPVTHASRGPLMRGTATTAARNRIAGGAGAAAGGGSSAPHYMTSKGKSRVETSVERELRLAAEAKQRLHEQVMLNKSAMERNRMVGSTSAAPLRSAKALTIPRSPKMHHTHNERSKPAPPAHDCSGEDSRTAAAAAAAKGPRPLTVPVGPSLHTETRARLHQPQHPDHDLPRPPARHHKVAPPPPPGSIHDHQSQHQEQALRLTVPHAPVLQTDIRAATRKPVLLEPSARDKEDEEELRHQFKARPLDRRVLESNGEMGVPKVTPSGVTEPQPFHLETENRLRRNAESVDDSDIHKHSVSSGGTQHHKDRQPMELVVPEPFQLATERRGQMHQIAFSERVAHEKHTEEAQREVHAHPMPKFNKVFMPQPSNKDLTEFQDFRLESVRRHEEAKGAWEEQVRRQIEQEQLQAQPRALPVPSSTYRRTFEVRPAEREPLVPVTLNFSSAIQAERRKAFDAEVRAKQEEEKRCQDALNEQAKRMQEEQLRRLRNLPIEQGGFMFKAKPVQQNAQPMVVGPSNRKLTVPVSPKLHTSVRAVVRMPNDQHHAP